MSDSGRQIGDCEHGKTREWCPHCLRAKVDILQATLDAVPHKWLLLAADLLELAANDFSNHGCNDYELPADWTDAERTELILAVIECVGGTKLDAADCPRVLDDSWAMRFLARRLRYFNDPRR